jgi:glutathione peroxidase
LSLPVLLCLLFSGTHALQLPSRRLVFRDAAAAAIGCAFFGGQRRAAVADEELGATPGLPAAEISADVERAALGGGSADIERAAPAVRPSPAGSEPAAFDFDVPFRGEPQPIAQFMGKATIVVNVKYDDPATLEQLTGLQALFSRFGQSGLHVLAFPTDQGWFEADDSNTLRLKFKSVYDFGQYPSAVVFDKADLLGGNALPLYGWLTRTMTNPWGVSRLVFDYEKFLLGADGRPLRRYPRKFDPEMMEADIEAVLAGKPLPPASPVLVKAWEDAKREAVKSEYAFKPGLNYYAFGSPAS